MRTATASVETELDSNPRVAWPNAGHGDAGPATVDFDLRLRARDLGQARAIALLGGRHMDTCAERITIGHQTDEVFVLLHPPRP